MAKKNDQIIKDCNTQIENLFVHFGKFLYENFTSSSMSYYFDPSDEPLDIEAKLLVRDITASKISETQPPKPVKVTKSPVKETKPQASPAETKIKTKIKPAAAKVEVKPKPVKEDKPSAKAVKAGPKPVKNKIAAVINGVKNVILTQAKKMETGQEKSGTIPSLGIERRGQLEPYTNLIVSLRLFTNKVMEIQADLDDILGGGLLHIDGRRTEELQNIFNEKIQTIDSLVKENEEGIKLIMEKKRKFLQENTPEAKWESEEVFLKEAAEKVSLTTKRIDNLINEVVGLFENIKVAYEKDLEAERAEKAGRAARLSEPAGHAPAPETVPLETADVSPEEPAEEMSDEVTEEIKEPEEETEEAAEGIGEAEEETEEAAEGAEEDAALDEEDDYGLFETAWRRLESESAPEEEKLAVLHTVFRNAPNSAVTFLYDFIKKADLFIRRQISHILRELDYPTIVDLYRQMINDEDTSLRLQGMMGLVKLGTDEAKHVIVSGVSDPDANIRRFVVNCLDHFGGESEAEALAGLSNDPDETVKRIAVRKLGIISSHNSFVTLVPKLDDPNIKIRKEVIQALESMVGTNLGYDYAAPEYQRRRKADKWKAIAKQSYNNPKILNTLREKAEEENKGSRARAASRELSVEKRKKHAVKGKKSKASGAHKVSSGTGKRKK